MSDIAVVVVVVVKEQVIIYRPVGRGGGGRRILGGNTWFLGEQKGGTVVTKNPKGRIAENFFKDSEGGPLKFVWKMKTWSGGDRKSHQKLLGGITSMK